MSEYPIFCRTIAIASPACTAVAVFGLVVGAFVGAFVAMLVIRGWMH